MAKTLKRHSDGNLLRVGDFLVEKCQDCEECSYCSDGSDNCTDNVPPCPGDGCCTPHRWSVSASGYSPCLACMEIGLGGVWGKVTSFSISAAYILTQTSACVWQNTNIGSVAFTHYSDSGGCTGSATVINSGNIQAKLTKTAANAYTFRIGNSDGIDGVGGNQFYVFDQGGFDPSTVITATADQCDDEITASSNYVSCGWSATIKYTATGGSHTITPCP